MKDRIYRGKRTDNGEWVYGYYVKYETTNETHHIIVPKYASALYGIEVDPDTIGQYTGLPDRNKKPIYEDDIVLVTDSADEVRVYGGDTGIGKVEFFHGLWYVDGKPNNALFDLSCYGYIEVIGNIYDNPEFLEESRR